MNIEKNTLFIFFMGRVYIYIYNMCIYTYICTYTYTYIYIHICIYIYICIYTVYIYASIYIYIHVYIYIYMYISYFIYIYVLRIYSLILNMDIVWKYIYIYPHGSKYNLRRANYFLGSKVFDRTGRFIPSVPPRRSGWKAQLTYPLVNIQKVIENCHVL